jgi:probable H4MPT-linked C1 transfer pathway protein
VQRVPLWGYWCPVSAEYFATTQDVYLLLGDLAADACSSPTADGRPATPSFAAERLARVVCADSEMLSADEIEAIARYIAVEHTKQITSAVAQVRARNDISGPLIASGAGAFLVHAAAEQLGVPCQPLQEVLKQSITGWVKDLAGAEDEEAAPGSEAALGSSAAVAAPAFALAVLLSEMCHA